MFKKQETVDIPASFRRMLFEGCEEEIQIDERDTGYEKATEPMKGEEFLRIVKKAMEDEPETQFRWADPEDYGNGSQPLKFDKSTDYFVEGDKLVLGRTEGMTGAQPWPFKTGLMFCLKKLCQDSKKKLSALVKGKTVGIQYYKDIAPIVGCDYSKYECIFYVRRAKPQAAKKLDDDWI